ncbi:uncharacterized protein LOC141638992 [Silene latifolia]|uniref:uncharacterized protein LOC141638992 n=1 Tax=Silene latifolia TaxID=37657 RepID=UPI003D783417
MVSWEKICTPRAEGGLGIRDSFTWNYAAIGKLVWWLYTKPDSLWVKWVHHIFMKGTSWQSYAPKADVSWSWKTIWKVKDKLASGYMSGQWSASPAGYSISSGYHWLRQKHTTVIWHRPVWNSWCIPKHNFINWLIAREALHLKDKLYHLGIIQDDLCLLCGAAAETHVHLFQ